MSTVSSSTSSETLARRAEMYARLDAISVEREAAKESRRETEGVLRGSEENLADFLRAFESTRGAVSERATALRAGGAADTPARRDACKAELAALLVLCAQMQHDTAQAAFFLPPYEPRQAHKAVAILRDLIEAVRAEVIPRQRFSFDKARERRAERLAARGIVDIREATSCSSVSASSSSSSTEASTALLDEPSASDYLLHDRVDETIILRAGELNGRDLSLARLKRCRVFVGDWMGGARFVSLEECEVFLGPVAGSVHIDHVSDSRFHLASRQIRIHHATRCAFSLLVLSNPIIEHSTALRFAPYDFSFPEREPLFVRTELAGKPNRWAEVNDFGWLRVQQSPNWSAVPEEERAGMAVVMPVG